MQEKSSFAAGFAILLRLGLRGKIKNSYKR